MKWRTEGDSIPDPKASSKNINCSRMTKTWEKDFPVFWAKLLVLVIRVSTRRSSSRLHRTFTMLSPWSKLKIKKEVPVSRTLVTTDRTYRSYLRFRSLGLGTPNLSTSLFNSSHPSSSSLVSVVLILARGWKKAIAKILKISHKCQCFL